MLLLSPDDVKKDKSESTEEAMRRSKALAIEESRLARTINQMRVEAEDQIEFIKIDFEEFKTGILNDKNQLIFEVQILEERKKEAIKPIEPIRLAAEKALQTAELAIAEANKIAKNVKIAHEKNLETTEELADRKSELDQQENGIKAGQQQNQHEANRLQQSAKELASLWIDYHNAIHQLNVKIKAIEKQEEIITADNKLIEERRTHQDQREQGLNNKETGLRSRYHALIAAEKEINGTAGNNYDSSSQG